MDRSFLREFAHRRGRSELIFNSAENYPIFDISLIQLSLKGEKTVYEYLKGFFKSTDSNPIIICVTATSSQIEETREVALAVKKLRPSALRIIGGPHVSVMSSDFLMASEFQMACTGEGVETIAEIALDYIFSKDKNTAKKIHGIVFKDKDKKIYQNKERKYLFNLDEYPHPSKSLDKFINDPYDVSKNSKDIIYILGGFGCPFNCAFCAQKAIHKGKIRERSAGNIFSEIERLYLKGFRKFAIVQETFTGSKKRIDQFCSLIEEHSLDIEWTAESRIDQINYSQLVKMKKSGLKFIQIGLESGDQKLLDFICKKVKIDKAADLIKWLNELKINTAVYLLVGLPGQDWQSILRSALFFVDNLPYNTATMHASTSITIPYPGTKLFLDNNIRIIDSIKDKNTAKKDWQARKPEVSVNDHGEFVGDNFTETDVMTSREILESLIYLDDLCYSLLHARFDASIGVGKRLKFLEYSNKMTYMIERRTIRDLIIQARKPMTSKKKQESLREFNIMDKDRELHFKDITESFEENPRVFKDFLASISFINGFYIMKNLSVPNRIKWMRFCCILWDARSRRLDRFRFLKDNEAMGKYLNKCISEIDSEWLWQKLQNNDLNSIETDNKEYDYLEKFGIRFYVKDKEGIFNWDIKI